MKESIFNVHDSYDDQTIWIYNTLSTGLVLLEERQFNKYFINKEWSKEDSDFLELKEMGFFIEDDFDELSYLKNLRDQVVNSGNKISSIMVAPTMDCNARCYYCFEHLSHHEKMTFDIADSVVSYIKDNWDGDLIRITWFGGEPLLAPDIIDYICKELKKNNINFASQITTNGFLINDQIIYHAKNDWNVKRIQVTIDGLDEEYNRVKNYINAPDDPFRIILSNLEKILKSGLNLRIRINCNAYNLESSKKVMEYLEDKFGHLENFSSYFAPLDTKSIPPIASEFEDFDLHPYLDMIKFSQKYDYFKGNDRKEDGNFTFDTKGILSDLRIYPTVSNCYASCPNVFAIDSKGDLYKCHRVLGRGDEYKSGNVKTGIVKNKIYNYFINTEPSFEECNSCKLLPICQGGCKINAIIYEDDHACCPAKSVLNELVEMVISLNN